VVPGADTARHRHRPLYRGLTLNPQLWTAFINEDFVNIAWDSAGVTTGPVTVPFVLSVGVGCSKVAPPVCVRAWMVAPGRLALLARSHMRAAGAVALTPYL